MARSTDDIEETMIAAQASQSSLSILNSPSLVAIYALWRFIVSTVANQVEQLWDIKKDEIEDIAASAASCSDAWLRQKTLEFQYDSVTPQVIQIDPITFAPSYPIVDLTKRIITRASVKTTGGAQVTVKVAKNDPPEALSVGELASLQAYFSQNTTSAASGNIGGIGFVGMNIIASSVAPDRLYVLGTIFYNGQFSTVIQANVIAAIDAYLASIPFDGVVKIIALTDAIQSVEGVVDLTLEDVAMRASATAFASRTDMVSGYDLLLKSRETTAGYIISEDDVTHTLLDSLTFTAA